ncbi:MAG: hypothetical protein J6B06_08210 [Lachnospiraceae bacterium]|nr:hypothetical protein [Lachnospiraceae bacterium]
MISLAGEWQFQLGYEDSMLSEVPFEAKIQIPGILQAQGYGEDITEHTDWVSSLHDPLWYIRGEYRKGQRDGVNIPFLSQPPKHYLGTAWYQKDVEIEEEGEYSLEIECTRWRTEAYIDGRIVGTEISLCAPHRFLLGRLTAGKHVLTVKIDNQMQYPYRPDGHGVSDALGATWNGMVGRVVLSRIPKVSMEDVVIKPEADSRQLAVKLVLSNKTGSSAEAELCLTVLDENSGRQKCVTKQLKINGAEEQTEIKIDCSEISDCWDEYTKALQHLTITVKSCSGEDKKEFPFGFRSIEAKEDGFYVNHRPTYLRGTHFGGDFPLTGCPSTKEEDWKRMFLICKDWGLNFIRFHSYCPPEAAFMAADRVGMYLQVECGMWNNFNEGNGMDEVLWEETGRILKSFGHHPSFLLLSPTNEPGGTWAPVLAEWYRRCQREEQSYSGERLYTRQSGWPYPVEPSEIADTDYVYFHRSGFGPYSGGTIRNSPGWDGRDYRLSLEGIRYPVITHEMGQWCSYPDFDIIDKFTGYMRPGNYKVFRENARAANVLSQNKEFVMASGKMQVQMYKEDLEANFRTPHIYGYELLDLHDYLGQGGALVGVLDAFWDNKEYVKPEEFRHFCNETVLLLRVGKRIFTQGETLAFPAELSHFGQQELKGMQVSWRITNSRGETVKCGSFEKKDYLLAKNQEIGVLEVRLDAEKFAAPECYTIELYVDGTELTNSWNIWLYEQEIDMPELKTAVYTRDLKEAKEALEAGKKVVYCPYLSVLDWNCPYLSAKPTFWNAQMGPRWTRGLGILCQSSHPALKHFPTREYQEYQWSEIIRDAKGINLEHYPADFKPIVQPVDEWNRNYKMSLVLEVKVGNGSLLLISSDLEKNKENSPVKKQLLKSLLLYADSEEFQPQNTVSMEVFLKSFADLQVMKRLQVSAKLLEYPQEDVAAAFDGNPNTTFKLEGPGYPYTLEFSWEKEEELTGLVYMPVQNQRNHEGDVREYEVFTWNGTAWEKAVRGEFISSFEPKRVFFDREIKTNGLRFVAKNGFGAECVQNYISDKKGWFRTEEAFEEKGISIAELALLTKQGALAAESVEEDGYVGAKTATIEIEE